MQALVKKVRSGVIHINYMRGQTKIGSGSGFLTNNLLVTNHHVIKMPEASSGIDILLRFDNESPAGTKKELRYSYAEFMKFLITGSEEGSYDYAVFNVPDIKSLGLFNFELGNPKEKSMCDDILFLGYPLEHMNLVCHKGSISSLYQKGIVSIIQLDASVNQSNSGGPLIDPQTGKVVGIITRKATGLTMLFNEFCKVFDTNIAALQQARSGGTVSFRGFDPMQGAIISQEQMKTLSNEIIRSANVGIGYAVSIEHLAADTAFMEFKS